MLLAGINSTEIIALDENDGELKLFFERVRAAKKIIVQNGSDTFVVELKPQNISDAARKMLIRGGPATTED